MAIPTPATRTLLLPRQKPSQSLTSTALHLCRHTETFVSQPMIPLLSPLPKAQPCLSTARPQSPTPPLPLPLQPRTSRLPILQPPHVAQQILLVSRLAAQPRQSHLAAALSPATAPLVAFSIASQAVLRRLRLWHRTRVMRRAGLVVVQLGAWVLRVRLLCGCCEYWVGRCDVYCDEVDCRIGTC